jgi:two-component system, OmpR family, phosphate regulon sensor histidine kinase PhoR
MPGRVLYITQQYYNVVKRTFTIITILISLSLIGIIFSQISGIKNMMLLREEQIRQRASDATKTVAEELEQHKGSYAAGGNKKFLPDITIDIFKPKTVGQDVTIEEIKKKLEKAFLENNLKDVQFEFGIVTFSENGIENYLEQQSEKFVALNNDTVHNKRFYASLTPPSGSAGENISRDGALIVVIPNIRNFVYKTLRWRIVTSVSFTIIILLAFFLTVRTMLRQKKLGKIKNDFINNMTHEFKTPIATISLAVDAMRNEKVINDREKLGYFSSIIKEENQRMNRQVETILRASQLERQEVDLNLKPVYVHQVIKDVVDNFVLQLDEKNGKVELQLNAVNDLVNADEVHFSNLVNNLVDNAVKYSRENIPPAIKLITYSNNKHFIMRIEDNGIGMNRETVKKIFERFYRAHTGNVHNVKGFGLGLSYVKTMVEAHHGEIKAESTLGKGTTFTLTLPLKKPKDRS